MSTKTEFSIDISSALISARQRAQTLAEEAVRNATSTIVTSLLDNGRYSKNEGLAHEIIRKKIEEYILSSEFADKVDKIIPEVIDGETANVVRALTNSKIRKLLFSATSPVEGGREDDPTARWFVRMKFNPGFVWTAGAWVAGGDPINLYTAEEKRHASIPSGGEWVLLSGSYDRKEI